MKLLIFTYAPAGLGHLRVTDALIDSMPKKYSYIMLGSYDKFITNMHRFTSTNPIAKWIFTISQYGLLEDILTSIYRWVLVSTSKQLLIQLKEAIDSKNEIDEVLVVATHFGMAHQIGAIKDKLTKETGKKIRLVVQVTDDTSQHIWCVKGADIIFVPSMFTKQKLEEYANKKNMKVTFVVTPYPISPSLSNKLDKVNSRYKELASKEDIINVSVPISGAAVGLSFVTKLITLLVKKSGRFRFWVLVKKSIYTKMFLSVISKLPNVNVITGRNDNEMINLYELLYQNNIIHIEITKPSEQAFKAVLSPSLVGGSILLFSSPVGRQEYENISFLVRHRLMPKSNYSNELNPDSSLASYPRAVRLSKDPDIAANFIIWGIDSGYFSKMASDDFKFSEDSIVSGEVGPNGAKEFWNIVEKKFGQF